MYFRCILTLLVLLGCQNTQHSVHLHSISLTQVRELDEIIADRYVKKLDRNEVTKGAISGMMSKLDEYSDFFSEKDYKQFLSNISSNIAGIGIEFTKDPEGIKVMTVLDKSPAQRSGVLSGDIITHVNGKEIETLSMMEIGLLLQGDVGSSVELIIRGINSYSPKIVRVKRERLTIDTVKILKKGRIPLIKISMFSEKTLLQMQNALRVVKVDKPIGLILDLRNNPGGLLEAAVNIASIFIEDQKPIITMGYKDRSLEIAANGDYFDSYYANKPIAVLINSGSASGAEILASALLENKKAILIGVKTFGKGVVQDVIPLETIENHAIKLTVAKYYSVRGNAIDKIGINPDILCDELANNTDKCDAVLTAENAVRSYY